MKNTISRSFPKILIALFVSLSVQFVNGQKSDGFYSRLQFGGGIGLSFGDGFFSGSISPSAIYRIDKNFSAGVGLNGAYSSWKNHYTSTVFGGSILGLYNVIPQIQVSAELEGHNVHRKFKYDAGDLKDSYWYPSLFLGAGFRTGNVTMGIRYDVLYDRNKSIYAEAYAPFVRVYF